MGVLRLDGIKTLIIEDQAEMRSTMKAMLQRMGANKLDVAMNGENALQYLRQTKYKLVLSDYELGRGKDGQQVLEEARFAKLLSAEGIYVMITAAQTVEMVMGALEYHPDGYITKPVTYDELHTRLHKIFRIKKIYEPINQAIDDGNLARALQECDILLHNKPKLALNTLRIKSKLLYDHGKISEAKQIYESIIKSRDIAWAILGYSKCLHACGQNPLAIEKLTQVTQSNERYVECYDLLAKIYEQEGDTIKGQEVLMAATEQSPKAILRQSHLAELALKNNDIDTAAKSARKAVLLSQNSCHASPEHHLRLCQALQNQVKSGGYRDKTYALTEIQKALKNVRQKYGENPTFAIRASILDALTLHNSNKTDKAHEEILVAKTLFDELPNQPDVKTITEMAEGLADCAGKDTALAFLDEIEEKSWMKPPDLAALRETLSQSAEDKEDQISESYNNKAVALFEKGRIRNAIELFEKALKNERAGFGVLLNAIQALVAEMQRKGVKQEDLIQCKAYLKRASAIPKDDNRYSRYEKLNQLFQDLSKK